MNDFIKTIQLQLYERVSSPLASIFTISWCLCNWKFIVILLSNLSIYEKFDYINGEIYKNWLDIILFGAIFPLISTAFWIFVYPRPAKFVYKYLRKKQQEIKIERQKIEDEEPLTREEAKQIRKDTFEAISKLESERDKEIEKSRKLQTRIGVLENFIEQKEREAEEIQNDLERVSVRKRRSETLKSKLELDNINLEDEKIRNILLRILSDINTKKSVDMDDLSSYLAVTSGTDKTQIEYYVKLLLKAGFLIQDGNNVNLTLTGESMLRNRDFNHLQYVIDSDFKNNA